MPFHGAGTSPSGSADNSMKNKTYLCSDSSGSSTSSHNNNKKKNYNHAVNVHVIIICRFQGGITPKTRSECLFEVTLSQTEVCCFKKQG